MERGKEGGEVGQGQEGRGEDREWRGEGDAVERQQCAERDEEKGEGVDGGDSQAALSEPPETLPPADDAASLASHNGMMEERRDDELSSIIAPPDTFSGDNSATPTPQPETESLASGTITPRSSPCDMCTPLSPLSPKSHLATKAPTTPVEVC